MDEMNERIEASKSGQWRYVQLMRRIALEILVGFIGVYAAFALSAYKDRRDLDERRHQIKRALIAEIQPLLEVHARNAAQGGYQAILASFDSALKAGAKPIPRAFVEPVGLNLHVWDATKQAGGLSVLDPETFYKVSTFYNNWSVMLAYYSQLRDLSVNVILPNIDRGPDAFYDPKTGKLRPDVRRLYYYDLRALDNGTQEALKFGPQVIKLLAADTI